MRDLLADLVWRDLLADLVWPAQMNPIFVDPRAGSQELIAPLRACGLPVKVKRLEYGDVAFEGRGVNDVPIRIGIEVKKLPDLVSSLRSGRLQGHQFPGMRQLYTFPFLLIQGEPLFNKKGLLIRRTGASSFRPLPGHMTFDELTKRLLVLYLRGGLIPWWSRTQRETVCVIEACFHTFTDKALDNHTSHLGVYQPPTLVPISQFRAAVMRWPGIGVQASLAAERQFGTILRAACAKPFEWANLTTGKNHRKLGLSKARALTQFLCFNK